MSKYKPSGQPTGRPSKKLDVKTWMQTAVVAGRPQQANIIIGDARQRGFCERTVNSIKKELNLYSIRKNRVWWWSVDSNPILPDFAEDPEKPHAPETTDAITDADIVKSAAMYFEGRAFSCDNLGDYCEAMLFGAKATHDEDEVIGILSDLLQDVRKASNSGAYPKARVQELMFQGLDAVLADKTLEAMYRTRLSRLTAYKPKPAESAPAPELTLADKAATMSLDEVERNLAEFADIEKMLKVPLSGQALVNKSALEHRKTQLNNAF